LFNEGKIVRANRSTTTSVAVVSHTSDFDQQPPPWRRTSSLSTSRVWCRVATHPTPPSVFTDTDRRPRSPLAPPTTSHHSRPEPDSTAAVATNFQFVDLACVVPRCHQHRASTSVRTTPHRQLTSNARTRFHAAIPDRLEPARTAACPRFCTTRPNSSRSTLTATGTERRIRQFHPGQLGIAGQDPLAGLNRLNRPGVVGLARRAGHRLASDRPGCRRLLDQRGTHCNTGSCGRGSRRRGNRTGPRLPQPARQCRHRQDNRHAPAKSRADAGSPRRSSGLPQRGTPRPSGYCQRCTHPRRLRYEPISPRR